MNWFTLLFLIIFTSVSVASSAPQPPSQTNDSSVTEGLITGQIMIKGKTPMVNGVVLLFDKTTGPPPHPYKYWRIPDIISGTDKKGKFTVKVSDGTYYLMVAQKKPDGEIGPPIENEFLYFHGDLNENPYPIIVAKGSKLNLGVLKNSITWSPSLVPHSKDITAVEGVVKDIDGGVIEDAVVFAYMTSNTFGRPTFVSDRTDKFGKFQLRVSGGTYFLKVRGVIGGGAPSQGEYISATNEAGPPKVTLTNGQLLNDIKITVERFSGKGSTGVDKPEKKWKNTEKLQAQ